MNNDTTKNALLQPILQDSTEPPTELFCETEDEVYFPLESLPTVLRSAVEEVGYYSHVDPALVALPGLAIAGLQLGRKVLVEEKPGLVHFPSLFLVGVAASGERKSSCYSLLLDGIKDTLRQEEETYELKKAEVRASNDVLSEQVRNIKASLKDGQIKEKAANSELSELYIRQKKPPVEPWNFGEDLTPQRLFQKIHVHGGAYGVFSSDARSIFKKIIGKGDGCGEEALYISGSWGDDIARSRVGSGVMAEGEDLRISKPALTVCAFIQPDLWIELSKTPAMRASGLLSRILVVNAKSQMGSRLESEDDEPLDLQRIQPFTEAVLRLRKYEGTATVTLSKAAVAARRKYYNSIEKELAVDGQYADVTDIASKATSMAVRLALIFHMLKIAADGPIPEEIPPIEEETWLQAQNLESYFFSQCVDSQRSNGKNGLNHNLKKIKVWLAKQKERHVLLSAITKGVRGIEKDELNEKLLPLLLKNRVLKSTTERRKGVEVYEII